MCCDCRESALLRCALPYVSALPSHFLFHPFNANETFTQLFSYEQLAFSCYADPPWSLPKHAHLEAYLLNQHITETSVVCSLTFCLFQPPRAWFWGSWGGAFRLWNFISRSAHVMKFCAGTAQCMRSSRMKFQLLEEDRSRDPAYSEKAPQTTFSPLVLPLSCSHDCQQSGIFRASYGKKQNAQFKTLSGLLGITSELKKFTKNNYWSWNPGTATFDSCVSSWKHAAKWTFKGFPICWTVVCPPDISLLSSDCFVQAGRVFLPTWQTTVSPFLPSRPAWVHPAERRPFDLGRLT